jgi:NTP pyrophosphatase (non-canonical NTP hydrolase)
MPCKIFFLCAGSKDSCKSFPENSDKCPHFSNGYCTSDVETLNAVRAAESKIVPVDFSHISDGYHTFDDLYRHRYALFGALCTCYKRESWKSKLHSDGTSFPGYFIAGITLPTGPVTYHIPAKLYNEFPAIPVDRAPDWDGHNAYDVLDRLMLLWDDPDTKLFLDTISFFGQDAQVNKAIEELAELIRGLSKRDVENIAEEMADVYIMLTQLTIIFNNSDKISDYLSKKKKRLYYRISGKREF